MINLNIDVSDLADLLDMKGAAQKVMDQVSRDLTMMVYGKAVEIAQQKLHSRRQMYIEGLSVHKAEEDVYVVELNAKVRWIEDGMDAHSMLDALLASPKAKTAKDGSKYLVVPFEHGPGKGPGSTTPAQQDLIQTIKTNYSKKTGGAKFGSIEKDSSGNARLGKIHSFDISDAPLKAFEGPGQGHGPVGDVRQGPNQRQIVGGGPGGGGTPFLQGVNVYQKEVTGADGKKSVKKSIMTFRIASSKHKDQVNRWEHPGTAPVQIMDEALKWGADTLDNEIAPQIAERILSQL